MKTTFQTFAVMVLLLAAGIVQAGNGRPSQAPRPVQAPAVCPHCGKAILLPAAVPVMPRADEAPLAAVEVKVVSRRRVRVDARRDARRPTVAVEAAPQQAPRQYSAPSRSRRGGSG